MPRPVFAAPCAAMLLAALMGHVRAADDASTPGLAIEDFALRDCYGRERSLSEFAESRLIVVTFLGAECPLAKLYGPRLESLRERFANSGVAFLGINSNSQDSVTELAAYRQRHGISFPLLKDPGNRVADRFTAARTPEAFLLDENRIVRYRGRIDDQYGVGYQRGEPEREDLAIAIEELLAGDDVSAPETKAVGCHIGRVRERDPRGDVTFTGQIAPIVYRRCVECHREGEIAPFPLVTYDDLGGWGETIAEVIRESRMPPWHANPEFGHFKNDARLTPEEKELMFQWIANGMPEGDPADLPDPPQFAVGWRIPEPDQVVYMSDEPFAVPAEGVVDYQYFEVDPGFTDDKYIRAAEARPDNREVVHHILVYIKPPGEKNFRRAGSIDGYAPGSPPTVYDDGLAMFVPAGSRFVFEMHYTPNGSVQQDRSYVGFKFLDKSEVARRVHGALAANNKFRIPPGDPNHEVTASRKISQSVRLFNLTPHMHLRGKSFRYEALYPDGQREVLLDVPRYDFNWQLTYELAEPKLLPKGTEIICTAHFDNSEHNPVNPDPTREIRWGDQSWDEMMIGFFDVVGAGEARDDHPPKAP